MKKIVLFLSLAVLVGAFCWCLWDVFSIRFSEPVAMLVFGLSLGGVATGLRRNYKSAVIHATEG